MDRVIDPWTPAGVRVASFMPASASFSPRGFPLGSLRGDLDRTTLLAGQHPVEVEQDHQTLRQLGDAV